MSIAKTLVALLAAILAAVAPAFVGAGPAGWAGWVNVIILVAGAVQVFSAPNVVGWDKAKTVAAAVSAGAVVVVSLLGANGSPAQISTGGWIQVALAVLGAVGVFAVPNSGAGRHEMRSA